MLGLGKRRLEQRLRQHGSAAMAVVLSTTRIIGGLYQNDDQFYQSAPVQATRSLWTMRVRIEPDEAHAFEAKIDAWLWDTERPWMNTVIPVLYDPRDHRKIALDRSFGALNAARQATYRMRDQWLQEQARNPLDRLTELMELRASGVLTDAEYDARKQKLLGQ